MTPKVVGPVMFAILTLAALLLAGCASPASDWPAWQPPPATSSGMRAPSLAMFQLVEISGTLGLEDAPLGGADCDRNPYDASVDLAGRAIHVSPAKLAAWRGNVSTLVWDHSFWQELGPDCAADSLSPLGWRHAMDGPGATGITLVFSSLDDGVTFGGRLLQEGKPYHHRVEWTARDEADGNLKTWVADLTFTYHGEWSWDAIPGPEAAEAYA